MTTLQPTEIMKTWQQRLVDVAAIDGKPNPLPKYGVDGLGGKETQAAIVDYQTRNNIRPITGQFDDATRASLMPRSAPHMSSAEVAILLAGLSHLPFVPKEIKEILMFPTIVQLLIALVPGIPDDISKVRAEIEELASTDSGVAKVRSFIAFARSILNEAETVVNKLDPQGAVVASAPIPAAVAALAPPTKQP